MGRRYNRKTGLFELSERDRENLLACVMAELELLNISGKDYGGPLVPSKSQSSAICLMAEKLFTFSSK